MIYYLSIVALFTTVIVTLVSAIEWVLGRWLPPLGEDEAGGWIGGRGGLKMPERDGVSKMPLECNETDCRHNAQAQCKEVNTT